MAVVLVDHMGDDLAIINNARESLHRQSYWETYFECHECGADLGQATLNNYGSGNCKHIRAVEKNRLSSADKARLFSGLVGLHRSGFAEPWYAVVA